ncbi:MAG: outer membrane beta-barrel protein [Deltaproteobacteria bacterium]|nr:outer membrane beta-barrel protein [Deltaproteobacteria bacterium]
MNELRWVVVLVCWLLLMVPNHVLGAGTETDTGSEVGLSGQMDTSTEDSTGADVFEKKGRYFHPFISLNTYYTDNLFNENDDEKDDIVYNIIPGIWLAFPGAEQPLLALETLNTAPGGLRVSRFETSSERRFQAYALYRMNIRRYDEYSDENTENHHAEGLLRYQFANEASIEVVNIYDKAQDPYATGTSTALDEYDANFFNVVGLLPVSQKFAFRLDYSNYYLDYDEDINSYRNRSDNAASGYVFYKIRPRTAMFLQYEYVDINYDEDTLSDSQEHHYFAGVRWQYSEKTRARFKLGYGQKEFDESGIESYEDIIGELQLDYQYSEKTAFRLIATRQMNETDISDQEYILSHSVLLGYHQRVLPRLEAEINLEYIRDSYKEIAAGGNREDDYYRAGIELGYTFRSWLVLGVGYQFTSRNSNDNAYDYDNNTFFLGITGAI